MSASFRAVWAELIATFAARYAATLLSPLAASARQKDSRMARKGPEQAEDEREQMASF